MTGSRSRSACCAISACLIPKFRSRPLLAPPAVQTIIHPDFHFGRNFTNDVALLVLERPVPFPTVKLNDGLQLAQGGHTVRLCSNTLLALQQQFEALHFLQ
jgi:hypothetical protein